VRRKKLFPASGFPRLWRCWAKVLRTKHLLNRHLKWLRGKIADAYEALDFLYKAEARTFSITEHDQHPRCLTCSGRTRLAMLDSISPGLRIAHWSEKRSTDDTTLQMRKTGNRCA
jgi:hypothetical protein